MNGNPLYLYQAEGDCIICCVLLRNAMQIRGNPALLRNVVRELLHHMGSVVAELFAIILQQRIAFWAEEHAVKAKRQAGFRKDFCTTNNIFIPRSLTDIQIQSRQKGKAGKLYCCFGGLQDALV